MKIHDLNSATKKQIDYIEILTNDLGLDKVRRNAHIQELIQRDFNDDINDLTKQEASEVISVFRDWLNDTKFKKNVGE